MSRLMNAYMPDPLVTFDAGVAQELVQYGRMLAARGYIHNGVGGIVIRVPHERYPDGVAYAKPMGLSMEEVQVEHVVVTDIPDGRLLHRDFRMAPGHQLNREILKLRPDINAVIHVHDDYVISFLACGAFADLRHCSLELPYVLNKPPYIVNHHVDIEENVDPVKSFIQDTNAVLMKRHGITTLGRSVSEAYHRLNSVTAEVRRIMMIEMLAAAKGTRAAYLSQEEVEHMYGRAAANLRPFFERNEIRQSPAAAASGRKQAETA